MMKRVLTLLLCVVMVFTMLPITMASAASNNQQQIEAEGGSKTIDNGNITLSKTVSPTEKENYFDVTLTVTDREIIEESATEVVIVLDISNTMTDPHSGNPGSTRFADARAAAANFTTQYFSAPNLGSVRKLGLVTFNTHAKSVIGLQQVSRNVVNQIRGMTVENLTGLSESAYDASHDRFTNIEGGLKMAKAMLDKGDPDAHKFIILLTDGFPTTYVQSTNKDGSLKGYDPYDSAGTRFKDYQWNRPCTYGTSYSDTAAKKAQTAAVAIRNAGVNIVSIGIDVNSTAQTIQGYLNKCKNAAYSTVERPKGAHPDNYVIGSANDHKDYRRWLGDSWTAGSTAKTGIGGGPDLAKAYYTGDSLTELNTAFNSILDIVTITSARSMNDPLVLDPMGEHVDFLGFYNKNGQFVTTNLDGSHVENGENTASFSSAINWRLDESGYTVTTKAENGQQIAYHTYTLKYRIRLENELADFVEAEDYFTNDDAVLKYTPPDEDPSDNTPPKEKEEKFPDPKVEGYLASFSFTKTNEDGTAKLSGAEFTLTHDGKNCAVCGGDATIHNQVATSEPNGIVSFTRIPSGHTYTLKETKSPVGYQPNNTVYKVVVAYDTVTVDGAADFSSVPNTAVIPTTWKLSGSKTADAGIALNGHTFRITDVDRNSVDVLSDSEGKFSFSKTFSGAGTYGFEIREVAGNNDMVVYDDTIYYVQVTVALNSAGTAYEVVGQTIRKSTGETADSITFHNAKRAPTSVELVATKVLDGRMLAADDFTFVLKDAANATLQTKTNTAALTDNVVFDELSFDMPGTYTYTISEVKGSENYMVYDETIWNVTVAVTAPAGSDSLSASVSYSYLKDSSSVNADKIVFTNKLVDSGYADFRFTKTDKDGNALSGASFTLTHIDCGCGATIDVQTATSDASGVVSFTQIPSGHNYRLDEVVDADGDVTIDGIDYQPAYYRDVVVSFGKVYVDGELIEDANDLTIVNIPLEAARVVLEGIKTIDGVHSALYDGKFTFTLTEVDANGENGTLIDSQTNMTSASEQNAAASKVIFKPLFYYTEGTHYYIVSESAQNLPGVVLDTTDYYVKVVVDSTGTKLNATVYVSTVSFADAVEVTTDSYGSFHGINFNNLLRTPTSASFQAKKVITSGTDALEAGDFTFVLKDANGNILEEVANAADGSVTFSAINYDTANTYHYTISEKVHSGDSVIYDTKVVDVQVAVTEDSGTSYTAAVTYDGSNEIPTFSNAYKGQLIVVKQDEAGSPVAGAEFTLTHSAECLCGTTVDAMTGTSRDDGHVMITNIPSGHTYILSETGVPTGYSPTPDHIVTVEKGIVKVYDLGASSPSTQEHHVIVNYPAVVISGDKQLVGRDLESGEFSFVLKDSNGNSIETVTNDSEGYFTFAPLTLTQEDAGKTLVYTVEEVEGTLPGVTYSTVLYKVTVQLDAHMKATVTYDQQENTSAEAENGISTQDITGGILFTNVYTPTPVEVVFGGEKTLSGRDLRAEDFHFELYPTDSDYDVPQSELPLQTAFNAADGTYSFKPVTFRGVGTFHYVVKELNNLLGGVTYDDTVYQIEVTVTDDTASGKLVASVKVNGEPADPAQLDFSNSYKITGNTEVVLSGVKALTGKAITNGAFTFELVDSNGTVVQTAENHADGTFSFEKLTFDKIDTYTYTVREKAGTETGMVYDSTVYNVSIQVLDNMAGGLRNEVSITDKDGNPVEQIQFHNEYHKPGELVLGGTKTVDGLTPGENYTFKLIRMSDGKEIDRVTSAADGSFFFDPITFSSEGTYLYEVVEQKGSDANMIYDSTVYHISVTVTKVGNEYQAVATIRNHATGAVVSDITFNNTHRDPATVYLTAEKTLKGRELVDGEFAFELYNITDPDNVILVQRVENDGNGDITFSGLQFNAKGTYRYRLVEVGTTVVSSTEPYMIYDKTVYEVEIVVNDPADLDSRDPFVIESVTYFKEGKACTAQELVFSNELKDPGTADFSFTKVNDQDAPMKDVAFTLTHADCDCGVEIPTIEAVSDANGIVTFKNIPSGHYYILSEKNEITVNGITYKKIVDRYVAVHYNTVYVDGVKAEQPGDVVIVNMPKTSARVTLEGIKTLAGHEVPDNVFTFDLVEYENVDGVFKEKEGGLKLVEHNVTMANTENVVASRIVFDPIGYNSTGTWYYKITERAEVSSTHPNDYIFDATAYYVTVVVADSGNDGNLQATVSMTTDAFGSKQTVGTASGNSTGSVQVTGLDFANSLRKSAEVVLQATKTIEGSHEDLEQFYFILKDEDGNVLETVTNNKNGNIQFSKLTFNDTGIYTFTIEERIDNVGHVVYDTTVYQVTVDVKPGTGDSYKATVTYSVDGVSAQPVFRNAYASSLVLKKVDENSKILPGAEFSLVHNCVEDCKTEIETMVSVARDDGYLMFSAIPSGHDYILTETKVPTGYTKASDHIVKVVKGQVFVYEVGSDTPIAENIHEIVNYSKPTITISGVKTLSGKHLVDKAFSFSLMETDSNFQAIAGGHKETVKNAANGSFVFTAITYDKAGTYHYVVQENIGSEAGMTYDNTVYQVTVTVANNDKGKLIATVSYTRVAAEKEDVDYITFHNIFAPQEISVNIPGVKTLVGRELAAGEFSFQLVNADGKVIQTVTNAADGSFSFDKLTFTAAGTYTYTVHEVAGNLENVTYDTQVYTVTVTITAGAHNALSADVVVTNENGTNAELRFVNDYEVPPTEPTEPSEPSEPTVPSEPSEPTEPTVPSEPSKPNIPDTGDHSGIFGWSAMCFLSLAAIIVLLLTGEKKGGKYLKR